MLIFETIRKVFSVWRENVNWRLITNDWFSIDRQLCNLGVNFNFITQTEWLVFRFCWKTKSSENLGKNFNNFLKEDTIEVVAILVVQDTLLGKWITVIYFNVLYKTRLHKLLVGVVSEYL